MLHLKRSAVLEDRCRLARDLQDGLLQTLTGIALQLETVHRLLGADSGKARERLEDIQALVVEEQRRLRGFIEQLKNPAPHGETADARWEARLRGLGPKIERDWGLPVDVAIQGAATDLPARLLENVYFLVREALTNCARHACASRVRAAITVATEQIHIRVEDDGRGFAYQGRYDLAQLTLLGWGPQSLMGRIATLRGQLILESSRAGACLEMTVPMGEQNG